ncbi:MAG: ABC-F family ATP-binding cassette domain-containing protein [Alphaproteobacteria bacterium]|nr:ABC-F family ATP-binding cassette domain-containing protein [Alphaproteobacteria bacterium]
MLRIENLVFDAWGRRFFDDASALIPAGAKVGLVGRNGTGKSTLFRLIKGELTPGGGEILMPKAARIGSVDQEHPATPIPLLETVLAAREERSRLLEALETAAPEDLADIYARLEAIGADRAPAQAAEILHGLGFSQADLRRPMAEFSGGWRMRVAMAAALFAEPDLLLLDEPTNYLDLEGALWLEARLKAYPRAALVISHDRDLLDGAVDSILHLSEAKLDLYAGNYTRFEQMKAERLRLDTATRDKIAARRAHLQSFVDRFGAKATKARQAQSRLKMIARLADVTPVIEPDVAPFVLPSPPRPLAPPLLQLEGASVGYGGAPVLHHLDLRLDLDDRIGLLGVNGSGKSTFAKLLAGELIAAGGMRKDGRLKVGWFHQHQIEALDPNDTPLEIIRRAMPEAIDSHRRARLAQFGMTADKVETRVASLSGGERARLLLNLVAMNAPHLLILDEPTNHLDIDSRAALCEALNAYTGAVLLITHDRSLMEMVADRLWLVQGGTIRPFDGDMDDYARHVLDATRRASRPESAPATASPTPPRPRAKSGASPGWIARKLAEAEGRLTKAHQRLAAAEESLAAPDAFSRPERARAVQEAFDAARADLARAEADWMALAEQHEAAQIT